MSTVLSRRRKNRPVALDTERVGQAQANPDASLIGRLHGEQNGLFLVVRILQIK